MLHPSRLRIYLAMLLLCTHHHPACAIKDNETRARGPLIDGADVVAQNWVLNSRRILSETSITNFGNFGTLGNFGNHPMNCCIFNLAPIIYFLVNLTS